MLFQSLENKVYSVQRVRRYMAKKIWLFENKIPMPICHQIYSGDLKIA